MAVSTKTLGGLVLLLPALSVQAQVVGPIEESARSAARTEGAVETDYNHDLGPRARAVRTRTQIDLDGRLDEPVWIEAPVITDFIQEDPAEGEPGTQRTEIRVAYDDAAIYIGAMLYDTNPITTRLARRDPRGGDFDFIQVSLDSYHDHETAYRSG